MVVSCSSPFERQRTARGAVDWSPNTSRSVSAFKSRPHTFWAACSQPMSMVWIQGLSLSPMALLYGQSFYWKSVVDWLRLRAALPSESLSAQYSFLPLFCYNCETGIIGRSLPLPTFAFPLFFPP